VPWGAKDGTSWLEQFMISRILISGASGFVGQALCAQPVLQGWAIRAALRKSGELPDGIEPAVVGEINGATDWVHTLRDVDVVIHLAARVHVMKDASGNPLEEFRRVNVQGTENLARQAVRAGVKRLVYVSSIKVNGEATCGEAKFTEADAPSPQDPYGISKWEAEQALHRVAQETGLEVVIVRPPLVYGPGVKGNFISLFSAIDKGIPLPLAGADNARSLVYVGNLVDALIACATHPEAAGKTYLVSDGAAVSTAMLVEKIAQALGRSDRSFNFSPAVLRALAAMLGKSAQVDRLFGSLRIDSQKIRDELAWSPPYNLEQGLRATADWYRSEHPR
jgi:nucleoside-diphosphate-sugar epimerase